MGILLYSDAENANVGLPPALLNGVQEHYRSYQAKGHYLHIEGSNHEVVSHDARKIMELKGFRLAEPEEQEKYFSPASSNVIQEEEASTEESVPILLEEDISPKRSYKKRG